jgi:hypothetical protein
MMGTHGLRRLHKGLLVDPELEPRLRRALKQRAEEVAADLAVAEKVGHLLTQSRTSPEDQEALAELRKRLAELRDFVEYMQSDFPLTCEGMSRLLLYSAVRSNLLRSMREYPVLRRRSPRCRKDRAASASGAARSPRRAASFT